MFKRGEGIGAVAIEVSSIEDKYRPNKSADTSEEVTEKQVSGRVKYPCRGGGCGVCREPGERLL